jgi:hypothetical protein
MNWRVVLWLAVAGALVALAGCSGSGLSPGVITGTTVQSLAADHMTAVQLLRSWLRVMYPPGPSGSGGAPSLTYVQVDPDTARIYGTDGFGRPMDITCRTDGSGFGSYYTAPGMEVSGTWGPWIWLSGTVLAQDIVYQYPDLRMEFRATNDFDLPGHPGAASSLQEGTATNSGGDQLTFRWFNNGVNQDEITVNLPAEHVTVELTVPAVCPENRWEPEPGQPAVGTMQTPGGRTQLRLETAGGCWRKWTMLGPDGTTGTFSLGENMSGSGQLVKNGVLQGALNWSDQMVGRLDLTSLESIEVTPLAAARDLAMDKWISSIAGLTPGAM